jgi:REP element-mobilizing transposase RayT
MGKLKVYHVTWPTHNSRVSDRMQQYKVKTGEPVWLDEEAEYRITTYFSEVIKKYNISCLAYNICGDHVHMLIVSKEDDLPAVVRTLKSISARKYNISIGVTKVNKGPTQRVNHLWARKYNSTLIAGKNQLQGIMKYIENNRDKHGLPPLDMKVKDTIKDMICSFIP